MNAPAPASPARRLRRAAFLLALLAVLLLGGRALWRLPSTRFFPPPRLSPTTASGALQPAVERAKVLFIGHSLVNTEMPAMLRSIAASLGMAHENDAQLRTGASLKDSWESTAPVEGVRARDVLPRGNYDVVVLTEAVDLDDSLRWSDSAEYAARFQRLAITGNPGVRVFLYETWHDRQLVRNALYGTARAAGWREFLDEDLGKWESIAADAAQRAGAPRMAIVPGGQAMVRLTDAIRAGSVPGLTSEAELFSDTVHLRPLGNYFIALVQFAAIHRKSPVGATNAPTDAAGQRHEFPPATATALQTIAWDAVANYAWSGLRSDG